MKMLMRLLFAASICLLIACTATAMPPSVDHTDNYTVVLSYGQTPYQIGYRASGNVTAWNWWDTGEGMQQQNLILAMVLDKTAQPVGGLSPPSFSLSQTRFRAGLNTYSWKADDDGTGNYSNNMDIWHWVPLNLTEHSNPELTFYTWHRIAPGDYGYVKVSTDDGKTWTELANYTRYRTGMLDEEEISLSAYGGKNILLAFNFVSDASGVDEGWYIDDIKVIAGGIQFFNWRLFGSTIFKDGATSTPPELVVEVSYPSYYSARTETIKLQEYSKGLYGGIFYYATNETYSGRYDIEFTNEINGTDPASVVTAFDTTLWGCQASNCHDAWSPTNDPSNRTLTDVVHPDNITSSTATNCLTACHTPSASQFLRATPVHLHEIVYGHYGGFICGEAGWIEIFNEPNVNIQMYRETSVKRPLVQGAFNQPSHASETAPVGCIDCHTKFVHDKTGGVSYQVALQTLHGTNITYGVHSNVSCEKCHGNLSYPEFTGDASLPGTLNGYVPEFMSYEESTETYVIDVDGVSGINVTVVAEDTNHEFLLSLIGPVDNTTTGLGDLNRSDPWRGTYLLPSVNGIAIFVAGGKICYPYGEYLNVVTFDSDSPEQGKWVVRILARSTGKFNYTITSNYNIARKPIIHIPWNCSECHQASPPAGCEGAETGLVIPDWDNYGLAYTHTDIGDDGSDDVTCRACHNALHDVGILDCVNCHRSPPPGHENFVFDYQNASYSVCVGCHLDPHYEPELAAGGNCTDCHLTGGANTTGIRVIINDTGFFNSVHRNITGDFDPSNYTAISRVCWGCHNNYSQQLIDPKHIEIKPDCEDCHDSQTPLNGDHIDPPQVREHQPDGDDITTNATIANCTICHNKSLVTDMPPDENVRSKNPRNYISHYGRQRTDIIVDSGNASNCSYCHCDEENMFNVTFENRNNTNITHGIDFAVNCTDCHGYGRIHDAAISSPTMVPGNNSLCMNTACHSNPSKPWFIDISAFNSGIHRGANCTDCHTALPIAVDGGVKSGGTYHHSFVVHKDTKQMNVTLNWVSGSLNLTLDANGTEINSSVAATDPDIEYIPSGNSIRYVITNPVNGPWIASVSDVSTTTRFDLSIDFIFRHPKHDQCYTNPCDSCHATNISYSAPPVAEHVTNDTQIDAEVWTEASCTDCHRNDITYPSSIIAAGVDRNNEDSMSAHYGMPDVLDTRECIDCHENDDIGRKWGDAPEPRNVTRYERIEDANDIEETLRTGEVCKLKNGYEIAVGPVSSTGSSIWVDLTHNGVSVQRELVSEGGVFEYEIKKDWIKSKSNAGDTLYGTGHETYKHRRSDESSYTTIVDLEVDDIFTSGMMGVATFKGLVLKSRMHVETEDKACYTCHIDEYRYYAPDDGDSYFVLRNSGADGDTDDADDITIGRLPINFTEHEHKILYAQSGWDLGYGYLLQITEIDLVGRKAVVELSKDGRILQREVVPEGEIFRYNTTITDKEGRHTMNDVTVFEMRISGVFRR
jgi:hypothetical protein